MPTRRKRIAAEFVSLIRFVIECWMYELISGCEKRTKPWSPLARPLLKVRNFFANSPASTGFAFSNAYPGSREIMYAPTSAPTSKTAINNPITNKMRFARGEGMACYDLSAFGVLVSFGFDSDLAGGSPFFPSPDFDPLSLDGAASFLAAS